MDLLERIKALCKENGMSQRKLEQDLNLGNGASSKWVKSSPSISVLQEISNYFNVSVDYLTGKSEYRDFYEEFEAKHSVKALISSRLEELFMSAEELSEKSNVPIGFINNLATLTGLDEVDYEYIDRIAQTLKISPKVLESALAKQEPPVYDNSVITLPSVDFTPISIRDFVNIPILGSVRAGQPMLAQDNIEGYNLVPKKDLCSDKEYFHLRVQGDSMNLEFKEGTLLLIEKTPWVENGTIAVVLIDGLEATVKKITQNENMIMLIPMSTNPDHVPQMYDVVKDQIQIVGRVKQAIKNY